MIAYNEDGEVFYIVDINNYGDIAPFLDGKK